MNWASAFSFHGVISTGLFFEANAETRNVAACLSRNSVSKRTDSSTRQKVVECNLINDETEQSRSAPLTIT